MSIPSIFTKSVDAASNGLYKTAFGVGLLQGRLEVAFNRASRATLGVIESSKATARSFLTGEFLLNSRGLQRDSKNVTKDTRRTQTAYLFSVATLLTAYAVSAPLAIGVTVAALAGVEGFFIRHQAEALFLSGRHDIEQAKLKKEAAAAAAVTAEPPVIAAEQPAPAPKPGA